MYKIIGADGNPYGPVSLDQVRAWITEGRANGQTLAQPEGATDWKKIADLPEFADLLAQATPPLATPGMMATALPLTAADAARMVSGPATGLMVVGILGLVMSVVGLIWNLSGAALAIPGMDPNAEAFARMFAGTIGVVSTIVSVGLSALILWGSMKMKHLENYGLVLAASILAMIPCLSPCCLLGLPIGIWAVVVLAKPEVKAAFH